MAKVKKITIKNILGIQELEFEPGVVTIIEGGNGAGKTSVLEAIKSLEGGGHDATLIRRGADEGETVMLLDDDTVFSKSIKPHKSELTARHPTMGGITAAQTFLRGLTDHLSVNPIEFLTSKDRVQKLLEAMPLTMETARLQEAIDATGLKVPDLSKHHALEALRIVRAQVFDERTGVNRVAKESRTTAEGLRNSLPSDFTSATVLENQLREHEGAHRDADRELQRKMGVIDAEKERALSLVREQRDAEVRRLSEEIRRVEREAAQTLTIKGKEFDDQKENLLLERRPTINQLGNRVTELREQLKAADRYENTRRMLEQARAKAEEHEEKSEKLTDAIAKLDRLRGQLLSALPIPGLEIRDGEVYHDDIPFPRLNLEKRVRLSVQVAKMRAGRLPLVCVDGLECLERSVFDAFVAELARSGLQGIVTRVTEGPLTVRTVQAEEAAHA